MAERKYSCVNCECKMQCIVANLHSDEEVCLKIDCDSDDYYQYAIELNEYKQSKGIDMTFDDRYGIIKKYN